MVLIHHPKVLSDFLDDNLGKASIWERIKKAGEDMFYWVEYAENTDGSKITDQPKKEANKKYVADLKNNDKHINTAVAETDYIKNVIEVFVHGNKTEENLTQLYTERGEYYQ